MKAIPAIVRLANYIEGDWDRMCVFFEGTPYTQVNRVLGFDWTDSKQRVFSRQYVIFTKAEKVTMHFPLPLKHSTLTLVMKATVLLKRRQFSGYRQESAGGSSLYGRSSSPKDCMKQVCLSASALRLTATSICQETYCPARCRRSSWTTGEWFGDIEIVRPLVDPALGRDLRGDAPESREAT